MTDWARPNHHFVQTHEMVEENLSKSASLEYFVQQNVVLYSNFVEHQGMLGAEFEAAIFSDIESLYED